MCNKPVYKEPSLLEEIHDHLKIQKMCSKAVCDREYLLEFAPDSFKTYKIFIKEVMKDQWNLAYVPNNFKNHVKNVYMSTLYNSSVVGLWGKEQRLVEMWHDDRDSCDDDDDDDHN